MSFLSSYPVVAEALAFAIMCGLVNVSHTLLYSFKGLYGLYASDPPVDGGAMLGRDRILGDSTTVWGLFVSLAVGAALQAFFSPFGLVIGGACYVGHGIGSFIKRRFHVPRGGYVPIIDHGNYAIVAGAVVASLGGLSWPAYGLAVVIVLAVHPLICLFGYALGMRDKKW